MISLRNDEETLRAIIGIQGNPNFERFLWWLRQSFQMELDAMDFTSGDQGAYRAGAVQQLHQILKNIHDARANLDSFSRAQEALKLSDQFK